MRLRSPPSSSAAGAPVPPPAPDVALGAAVGLVAAVCLAAALAGAPWVVALAACAGLAAGGVTGLLVWVSSAPLPDAPIPALRDERRGHGRCTRR